jgi:tRNA threonylcarbamoyladenosine biosynthesis protein TsaE
MRCADLQKEHVIPERFILDEPGMLDLGQTIAGSLGPGGRVFLTGDLGTGKTTLARALIRALGVSGAIPSPSFILDAVYTLPGFDVHHMDFYRLSGAREELAMLGFDEILESSAVVIVEWADRFPGMRDLPGLHVTISCLEDPLLREVVIARRMAGV